MNMTEVKPQEEIEYVAINEQDERLPALVRLVVTDAELLLFLDRRQWVKDFKISVNH